MLIRELNENGIKAAHVYINTLRDSLDNNNKPVNFNPSPDKKTILLGNQFSKPFKPEVEVNEDPPRFHTASGKYDLGRYLVDLFRKAGVQNNAIRHNSGFWSWIGLYWLEAQNYQKPDGSFPNTLQNLNHYYLQDSNRFLFNRHILFSSWNGVDSYGVASKVILTNRVYPDGNTHVHGDMVNLLLGSSFVNLTVVGAAYRLYWDDANKTVKKKALGRREDVGGVYRLVKVMKQLSLTYDMQNIAVDQFLGLLPEEFDRFLKPAGSVQ